MEDKAKKISIEAMGKEIYPILSKYNPQEIANFFNLSLCQTILSFSDSPLEDIERFHSSGLLFLKKWMEIGEKESGLNEEALK